MALNSDGKDRYSDSAKIINDLSVEVEIIGPCKNTNLCLKVYG